jgi:hypothetical protein
MAISQYNGSLVPSKAPNLPIGPVEYSQTYQDQLLNVLRLYFNQIDNAIGALVATGTVNNPSYVITNNENTYAADWGTQVGRGKVAGTTVFNLFSNAPAQSTTIRTIWELGGTTEYVFPTSAVTMTVVSSSATDTGTAQVVVSGLDSNYDQISETITLNGTTPVSTTKQYLRINGVVMIHPAAGQVHNVGNITVANGGITYGYITANFGKSQGAYYTVPRGYTLFLYQIDAFSGDANGNGYVNLDVRVKNNAITNPTTYTLLQTTFQLAYAVTRTIPIAQTEKTDLLWRASSNSGTHSITLLAIGFLMDNTQP